MTNSTLEPPSAVAVALDVGFMPMVRSLCLDPFEIIVHQVSECITSVLSTSNSSTMLSM